ncbi:MAG: hypothetical protein WBE76_10780 [Terracidiphilus sp.]
MRPFLKITLLLIASSAAAVAQVSPVVGIWKGTVTPASVHLPFILNIVASGSSLAATTQSPNQNPGVYAVDSISSSGNTVTFQQAQFGMTFTGTIQGNVLSGTMTQGGNRMSLELIHAQPSGCSSALAGAWKGTFTTHMPDIPVVLAIAGSPDNLSATMQFPSQGPNAFPVDSIVLAGQTLTFRHTQFNAFFSGALSGNTITGTLTQNGFQLPATFTKQ